MTWDDVPLARGIVRARQPSPRQPRKMTKAATSTRDACEDTGMHALWRDAEPIVSIADLPARAAQEDASSIHAVPASVGSQVQHEAAVVAVHGPPRGTCHRAPGEVLDIVEGVVVRVEERGIPGTPGHYRRLCVTCPWHSEAGAQPCRLRRSTGARQTAAFGVNEPVAYLGAWLAAGPARASRDEHVQLKPSAADTRVYAEAHGLM